MTFDWGVVGTIVAVVGSLIGGIAYMFGLFHRSKNEARMTALETALAEVKVWKDKADRLEQEVAQHKLEITALTTQLAQIQAERDQLRNLVMFNQIPPILDQKFAELLKAIEKR